MTLEIDTPVTYSPSSDKNYGFVIDNRKCIGCHACSVACKAENEVPLSVNRTWVKYVETGVFPDSRRHFQVTRCNHCENPPCTRICPTEAMYQRADGIVEFDNSLCIGCKGCLQACPYDAIYIDPNNGTAAKCHYCAHRTDIGLEPACVVVCPEHAIIAGDMNDPTTEISHLLATTDVTVRKPEQGTSPKLFYIEGNDVVMHPTAVPREPETFMWADVIPLHGIEVNHNANGHQAKPAAASAPAAKAHSNGTAMRAPQPQGQPSNGPITFGGGTMAEHMVQVGYNAQHHIPWHWPVPAYLVTKGIGSGLFMLLSLGVGLNLFNYAPVTGLVIGFLSLLFIAITTGLLVYDLEKPERFLYMVLHPQWRSWLTRGAFILIGFSAVAGIWWLIELLAYLNVVGEGVASAVRPFFLWAGFPFALMTAIYTAFLFAQAEGRDLWQSPLLPFHLVIQAFMVGSGVWLLVGFLLPMQPAIITAMQWTFAISIIVDAFVTLAGEFGIPHASEVAARAAHEISHGRYKTHFWSYSIWIGHVAALMFVLSDMIGQTTIFGPVGALCAIYGLYMFEYAFVMAPQEIPNS